jgi:hypothetical protein
MRTATPVGLGVLLAAATVAVPFLYQARTEVRYRNFRVVEPGVLYRSGQMSDAGLARVAREFGVRAVVSLRDVRADKEPDPDLVAEEQFCAARRIAYLRLSPKAWGPVSADGEAPIDENLREFLRFVAARRAAGPILVHCMRGVHRTGGYTAVYRMEFNGWSSAEAMAEMRERGYDTLAEDPDILDYLSAYTPGRLTARVADPPRFGFTPPPAVGVSIDR